jgi:hypothetical protein
VDLVELLLICRACGADVEAEVARLLKEMRHLLPRAKSRK